MAEADTATKKEKKPLLRKETSSYSSDSSYGTNISSEQNNVLGVEATVDSNNDQQHLDEANHTDEEAATGNTNQQYDDQRDCERWAYRRAKAWAKTASRKLFWETTWRNLKLLFTVAGVVLNTWASITEDENDAKRAIFSIVGTRY